ncbi:MAG TPA: allantoinase AllB [Acidimicrobiia bacterium]|nr:allantoinase AllB [Acidimicrobiia bacterium]
MSRHSISSSRVFVDGGLRPAVVVVEDGVIVEVAERPPPGPVDDHGDLVVMPALVDTHVHVNEPGRTEWEGFATATDAAAAGGVAVIVDMPLNSIPPTVTLEALEQKRAAAAPQARVDVGFWGGFIPGSEAKVAALAAAGVFGFKAFLSPSGVDEFPNISLDDLPRVLEVTGPTGLPLIVHAESPAVLDRAPEAGPDYITYLASRPPAAEVEAIEALIAAVASTGAPAHVLHLSAADALEPLAKARADGLPITVETCPHYLTLKSDDAPDDDASWKCAPPIRDGANQDALWSALGSGVIDLVVSDHSPCPGDLKVGGFDRAWGGIASLELRLPAMWTETCRRGHDIANVVEWLCAAPARLVGLPTGRIEPGMRGDLVVWDPDARFTVDAATLRQRHPHTPYHGRELSGIVHSTYARGIMVYGPGVDEAARPGRLLRSR